MVRDTSHIRVHPLPCTTPSSPLVHHERPIPTALRTARPPTSSYPCNRLPKLCVALATLQKSGRPRRERVAIADASRLHPATEPGNALRRRAVRERLRYDTP